MMAFWIAVVVIAYACFIGAALWPREPGRFG